MRVKKLICAMLVLAIALTGCVAVACNKKEKEIPERGTYYSDTALGELQLVLEGKNFNIIEETGTKKGTYKLSGESLTLKVSGKEKYNATYKDDTVKMTYGNYGDVTLVRKKTYAVKFIVEGQDDKVVYVLNGRTLAKPDDPVVAGKEFVGWYLDEAGTQPYSGFGIAPVKGELTLYAKFSSMTRSAAEYTISFDLNAEGVENNIPATQTIGGKLYNAPTPVVEGKTFCGWWISDFEDGNRLTYKFDETEAFDQDVTLFAAWEDPFGLEITSEGATWNAKTGESYDVLVETADSLGNYGKVESTRVTVGRYNAIDFDANASEYRVTVSNGGKSSSRYYNGRALKRVSLFDVVGKTLIYKGVPNAEQYTLNIECGNGRHIHSAYNNGLSTVYDFSGCELTSSGITFEVTASANGYTSSTGKFVYNNPLEKIENIYVDEATETFTWPSVNGAMGYEVTVNNGTPIDIGNETSFSYKTYAAGTINFAVAPYADGYSSPEAITTTVSKSTLPAPSNLKVSGNTLSWSQISGASGYTVTVLETGKTKDTTEASIDLVKDNFINDSLGNTYTLNVKANGSGKNSLPSDGLDVVCNQMYDTIEYTASTISWRYVVGAEFYRVYLNGFEVENEDGEPITTNSIELTNGLTQEGINEIEVLYVDKNDVESASVLLEVNAYKVTLERNDGTEDPAKSTIVTYRATGDKMNLPKLEFEKIEVDNPDAEEDGDDEKILVDDPRTSEIEFADWYVDPLGAKGNARRVSERTFSGTNNVTYYADWAGKTYKAQLTVNKGSVSESGAQIETIFTDGDFTANKIDKNVEFSFNSAFTLPGLDKMVSNDAAYAFYGWYHDTYNEDDILTSSVRLTNPYGVSIIPWNIKPEEGESTITLTAHFVKIFNFSAAGTSTDDSGVSDATAYAISGIGANLRDYTSLKIPYKYDGKLVTDLYTNAFSEINLTNLKLIEIPDTISYIAQSAFVNGGDMSADTVVDNQRYIRGCTALKEINVYSTGEANAAKKFSSNAGVLFEGTTLTTFPAQHAINYYIPSGTTAISKYSFLAATGLRSVTIPSTVTTVQQSAFYSCTSLAEVKFLAGGTALTLEKNAFYGCASIRSIDLPAHLTKMSFRFDDILAGMTLSSDKYYTDITFAETFRDCINLREINIDPACKVYESKGGMIYDKPASGSRTDRKLLYVAEGLNEIGAELTVDDVGEITDGAFNAFNKIKSVTLPSTLKTIGKHAFRDCTLLVEADLQGSVDKVDDLAFAGCSSLESIDLSKATSICDYAFYLCTSLKTITIPGTVSKIGEYAIAECSGLIDVTLEEGIQTIGAAAFYNDVSLTEISIPDSVTGIEMQAFQNLKRLVRLELGANIVAGTLKDEALTTGTQGTIRYPEDGAFKGNRDKYTITSADGITGSEIEANYNLWVYDTFRGDISVREVCYKGDANKGDKVYENETPGGDNNITPLQSQLSRLGLENIEHFYKYNESGESSRMETVTNNDGEFVFFKNVATGEDNGQTADQLVTYVGNATEITMPEFTNGTRSATSQYEIGKSAFANNTVIEKVSMDSKVSVIHAHAFDYCTALTTLDLTGVTALGGPSDAVLGSSSILGSSASDASVGEPLFDGAVSLKTLTIPSTVQHIAENCFQITASGAKRNACNIVEIIDQTTNVKSWTKKNGTSGGDGSDGNEYTDVKWPITSGFVRVDSNASSTPSGVSKTPVVKETADGLKFKLTYDSKNNKVTKAELIGYAGTETELVLPDYYDESSTTTEGTTTSTDVTYTIGNYAFAYNKKITSITIPATVKTIGTDAFTNCTNLTYVDLGNDYEGSKGTLDSSMFRGCTNLTTLKIGTKINNIKIVEGGAFAGNPNLKYKSIGNGLYLGNDSNPYQLLVKPRDRYISSLRINRNCTSIANNAFAQCAYLTSVDIPDSVKNIGSGVFYSCRLLESVTLGNGITSLGGTSATSETGVFERCKALKEITIPASVTSIGVRCFYDSGLQFITFLGESVTKISTFAFSRCYNLETMRIPDSVKTIGEYAFQNASALKSVYIGKSVTSIGVNAFDSTVELTVSEENKSLKLINGAIVDGNGALIFAPDLANIPEGVKVIPLGFAYGNTNITALGFPSTLEKIGNSAFGKCTALKTVEIRAGSGSNGDNNSTPAATSLEIGSNDWGFDGVYTNSSQVFADCTELTTVTINNKSLTDIKVAFGAFSGCSKLKDIIGADKITQIGASAFSGCGFENLNLPYGLKQIGKNAFGGNKALVNLTIPATVNYIGEEAFNSCTKLNEVLFMPKAMTTSSGEKVYNLYIGENVFNGCEALSSESGKFYFNDSHSNFDSQEGCTSDKSWATSSDAEQQKANADRKIKNQLFGASFSGQTKFYYRCKCADGATCETSDSCNCKDQEDLCWHFDTDRCDEEYHYEQGGRLVLKHIEPCKPEN